MKRGVISDGGYQTGRERGISGGKKMALMGGSRLVVREGRGKRKLGYSGCLAGLGPGDGPVGFVPFFFLFF
jgi:hypothetical protein